jgi:hypothetical protein
VLDDFSAKVLCGEFIWLLNSGPLSPVYILPFYLFKDIGLLSKIAFA